VLCVVRVFCHREEEIDPNFVHGLRLLVQAANEVPTPGIRICERLCGHESCHVCGSVLGVFVSALDRTLSERS
jgi:hypothetical protein